jgi:hypothetical protein
VIDNRFPALFEVRRLFWPCYETLSDPARYEQGIDGFLEHIFLDDFRGFTEVAQTWTGHPVRILHRRSAAGEVRLEAKWLQEGDTLIVISLDGPRSGQHASTAELIAIQEFLDDTRCLSVRTMTSAIHGACRFRSGTPDVRRNLITTVIGRFRGNSVLGLCAVVAVWARTAYSQSVWSEAGKDGRWLSRTDRDHRGRSAAAVAWRVHAQRASATAAHRATGWQSQAARGVGQAAY